MRRQADQADAALTYRPSLRLKIMRSVVESCRVIPVVVSFAIAAAVLAMLQWVVSTWGYGAAALAGGLVAAQAGMHAALMLIAVAFALSTLAIVLSPLARLRVLPAPATA